MQLFWIHVSILKAFWWSLQGILYKILLSADSGSFSGGFSRLAGECCDYMLLLVLAKQRENRKLASDSASVPSENPSGPYPTSRHFEVSKWVFSTYSLNAFLLLLCLVPVLVCSLSPSRAEFLFLIVFGSPGYEACWFSKTDVWGIVFPFQVSNVQVSEVRHERLTPQGEAL